MGDASEMSMSMSVQSAWEDLVVENPNRAKLEGCLLSTIMLVVCCIIALLVYVFVQLQPQGNVIARPPYWKTTFYDDPPNRQFALRMIGWINWTTTRCVSFSDWACGGRAIESSSLAISETAEAAARDYAMEYAVELIERKRSINSKEPNEDTFEDTPTADFNSMATVFSQCRKGLKTKEDLKKKLEDAWPQEGPPMKFVPGVEGAKLKEFFKGYHDKLYFFPFGDAYVATTNDVEAKTDILTVLPPKFIGREMDDEQPYRQNIAGAVKDMSAFLPSDSCCSDDGGAIYEIEKLLFKEMATRLEDKFFDTGSPEVGAKLPKDVPEDTCTAIYEATTCRFISGTARYSFAKFFVDNVVGEGWSNRGIERGDKLTNWAFMKYMILLSPFVPSDDPSLANFYKVVSMYHRKAEMPHKDILCMHLLEHYYRDTLLYLFSKDGHLKNVEKHMDEAVQKVGGEVGVIGGKGQADLFSTQLLYPKSPFTPEAIKKMDPKSFFNKFDRLVYFNPDKVDTSITLSADDNPFKTIFARAAKLKEAKSKGFTTKDECWLGSIFEGEPFYDPLHDLVFIPSGLAVAPYYHNDTEKIKHSLPGFLPKIYKAMTQRFVSYFMSMYKGTKKVYANEPRGAPSEKSTKIIEPIGVYVTKQIACFKKAYGPDRMWDLFYEKSGVQLAYQMWRLTYNHLTVNKDMQLRLGYVKFISEEMIFFITAANGHCYTANPLFASKKEQALAPKRVNSVLYSKLLGQSMLCAEQRDVYKPACGGLYAELQRVDEALWTVESWRNAKKVLTD